MHASVPLRPRRRLRTSTRTRNRTSIRNRSRSRRRPRPLGALVIPTRSPIPTTTAAAAATTAAVTATAAQLFRVAVLTGRAVAAAACFACVSSRDLRNDSVDPNMYIYVYLGSAGCSPAAPAALSPSAHAAPPRKDEQQGLQKEFTAGILVCSSPAPPPAASPCSTARGSATDALTCRRCRRRRRRRRRRCRCCDCW